MNENTEYYRKIVSDLARQIQEAKGDTEKLKELEAERDKIIKKYNL